DEILVAFDVRTAAEGADDSRGYGLAESKWITDREDKIADLQPVGIAHRNRGQIAAGDLQHSNIGFGVASDQPCFELSIVLGRDLDAVAVFRDVAVRQYIALRGIDDDTRSGSLGLTLYWLLLLQVEEAPKERILQQRVVLAHPAAHRDADDTRGHPTDDRGDAVHWSAAHLGYRGPGEHQTRGARRQSDPA